MTIHHALRGIGVLLLLVALGAPLTGQGNPNAGNWPSFRGPNAAGVADDGRLPATWDATTSTNILWKTPIPGLGHSSPIIWGNRLFVSTAISGANTPELKVGLYGDIESVQDATVHRWIVYCLDKQSGKILWEKTVRASVPLVKRHPKATHAN
jgi:hypothetical protein